MTTTVTRGDLAPLLTGEAIASLFETDVMSWMFQSVDDAPDERDLEPEYEPAPYTYDGADDPQWQCDEITLYVTAYGCRNVETGDRSMAKVVFTGPDADMVAANYVARHQRLYIVDFDETAWGDLSYDLERFPLMFTVMHPGCKHGKSGFLCDR